MWGAGSGFALWIGWVIRCGKSREWLGFALLMGIDWVRRGEVAGGRVVVVSLLVVFIWGGSRGVGLFIFSLSCCYGERGSGGRGFGY